MAAVDKVKVVVVGDSGVGKSSLVNLICHDQTASNTSWTIGCSVEVKLHDYKVGTPTEKTYFVELWDIGASNSHKNSRALFYHSLNGIILVHDLTNKKSQLNLRQWLSELLDKEGSSKGMNSYDYDPEQFVGSNNIPILVIGTKFDLTSEMKTLPRTNRYSTIADECGADEINLDCLQVKSLAPGSSNAVKLGRFFDKVIERRYYSRDSPNVTSLMMDRRRGGATNMKLFHVD
ncbi:RABL3 (predicted) [Pycnogonum litorale]